MLGGTFTTNQFTLIFSLDPECNIGGQIKIDQVTFNEIQGYIVVNNQIYGISQDATQRTPSNEKEEKLVSFNFNGALGKFYIYFNLPQESGSLFANLVFNDSTCKSGQCWLCLRKLYFLL